MRGKAIERVFMTLMILTLVAGITSAEEAITCPKDQICIDPYETFSRTGDVMHFAGSEISLVRIIFDDTIIFARNVTIHEEERWALLEEDVRVERDGTVITSEKATLAFDDEVYLFDGAVHVIDTKTKPREIWTDHMEYDGESGNMTAEGNVRMDEEGRWFRSIRMVYDAEAERAILEGDVTVVDERGEIFAQHLDIDLEKEAFTGTGPGRIVLLEVRKSSTEPEPASESTSESTSEPASE